MRFAKREVVSVEHIVLPSLAQKIADLHAEIDALVDRYIADCMTPGVPGSIIKACLLTSKVGACKCAQFKLINNPNEPN